ncbi:phosphotransferase family protein [Saccharopolyspora shandongensis]|uniref:phosphotransferase family protein n=1 Tax=Saccharopolyspora shandongensis TaxID=418495 RepID=UPI0033D70F39
MSDRELVLIEDRLTWFLEETLGRTGGRAQVSSLFAVGGSRLTFPVCFTWTGPGGPGQLDLVVKQDPPVADGAISPGSVIDEYDWYRAMAATGEGKVPTPVGADRMGELLGSPFMVVRAVPGDTDTESILGPDYDGGLREAVAVQAFADLGRIHAVDVATTSVPHGAHGRGSPSWATQLDYWENVHDRYGLRPLPMLRLAVDTLRRNPPPSCARPTVVHGDFRLGNFLYSAEGVHAILDWELAHVGDPHEDLAWALKDSWRWADPSRVWGFAEDEDALLAVWERTSGLRVDRRALAWWRVFSHVKLSGLLARAGAATSRGDSEMVRYVLLNWREGAHQEAAIARDLAEVAA